MILAKSETNEKVPIHYIKNYAAMKTSIDL